MARPKLVIDGEQVQKLASLGCSARDIAYVVGCSVDTLDRRFAAELDKGRAEGRTTLRRRQWKAAMDGNVAMLIFLGKSLLGQTDRADVTSLGRSVGEPPGRVVLYMPSNGRGPGEREAGIAAMRPEPRAAYDAAMAKLAKFTGRSTTAGVEAPRESEPRAEPAPGEPEPAPPTAARASGLVVKPPRRRLVAGRHGATDAPVDTGRADSGRLAQRMTGPGRPGRSRERTTASPVQWEGADPHRRGEGLEESHPRRDRGS
jgi:hypothetical protein